MHKLSLSLIIGLFLFVSCSNNETSIINSFPDEMVEFLEKETGVDVHPLLVTRWFPEEDVPGTLFPQDVQENGISVYKIEKDKARRIFSNFYEKFPESEYSIFLTNIDLDKNFNVFYDIGIIKTDDQFEIIKLINTEAVNYDISNEEIINKLKEWSADVPFRVMIVDEDRIEAAILELPEDIEGFAERIFEFCPDVVYQGTGTMEELVKELEEESYFWLWWD